MSATQENQTYDPRAVEARAQQHWNDRDAYRVTESKDKKAFYACSMLPYPSGKLHMGHVRNYTINDMLTRYLRMNGHNVLMPMGWDAFGLPAENAALKNKVPPAKWTYENIAYMKKQMKAMGLAIDWSREIATCQPSYYQWNQWLFLKMLEAGICERRTQTVNWDPVDQTVLANEQVIDGKGWRSGAAVEKREIPGYYLNITKYADELLSAVANPQDPNYLSGWPERVRLMQENWIGKSEGVRFAFAHEIKGPDGSLINQGQLWVFTTRADTLMGVTFCAVAPEHPLAVHAAAAKPEVQAFIEACKSGGTTEAELATQEKKGVATGLFVTHPLSGEQLEVWVGNYVLMSYGDGAVMGVPAHDERDFAFAQKYGIAIKQVIAVEGETFSPDAWADWYGQKFVDGQRGRTINSGALNGLDHKAAVSKVAELLAAQGIGEKKTTWRLRDWGISRQRYWGTPIPIIHCGDCGAVPVPEKDLPVVLPEDVVPDGSGNPLKMRLDFLNVGCPQCGKPAQRETDTMDTFVDSSWYFLRYTCTQSQSDGSACASDAKQMVDERTNYWMGAANAAGNRGMDQYIGGIEHAILHLLYARFWTKVMRDLGLIKIDEPFKKLLTQGMVLNHIYSRKTAQGGIEYFWPSEVENTVDANGKITGAKLKTDGSAIEYGGVGTMSKSKNNGVDPQELIGKYGADTARLYTMFTAPPEATLEWNETAVEGSSRFLRRVWDIAKRERHAINLGLHTMQIEPNWASALHDPVLKATRREVHLILKQASYDYSRMQYNTVVSACMKLLKTIEACPNGVYDIKPGPSYPTDEDPGNIHWAVLAEAFSILLRVLYPACPHLTHVLWQDLGYAAHNNMGDLLDAPWPSVAEEALVQDEIELMLQVNGKLRGSIKVSPTADKAAIEALALASEDFAKFSEGKAPKKVIIVPGRLVNLVV